MNIEQENGAQALPEDATPVPSPCTSVCRMSPATGLCEGCLRTIAEIAGWRAADDATRRAVWRQIRVRARNLQLEKPI